MQNFSTKIAALAIAITGHGCVTIPVPIPIPIPIEVKASSSPSPSETSQPLLKKYQKTCYADALTEEQGRKIIEGSGNLESAGDKLMAAGDNKSAIQKYNEAAAAALNEAIADGTAEDMEDYTGDIQGFQEKNRPLIQRAGELNFKIGRSYVQLKKFESAIDCFNGTLKIGILPPNDAIAHLNRGDAYERIGDKIKAKDDFQQAVTLFKKYKQPSYEKISEQRLQAIK